MEHAGVAAEDRQLYERTALSKKPDDLIRRELAALRDGGAMTPDMVFQDPYMLDFLGLKGTFNEKDLESALLREIERLILELGAGVGHRAIWCLPQSRWPYQAGARVVDVDRAVS